MIRALLLMGLLSPGAAWAQACCTGTGAGEFGVVGRCRQAVLGASLSYTHALASFDKAGERQPLEDAIADDVVWTVGGGARITPAWQIHGSVPLRLQYRGFTGLDADTQVGLGDVTLGTRYLAVTDPMTGISQSLLPFVDLLALVRLPTGRAPEATEVPTGADVMGAGGYELTLGVRVSKFITPNHALVVNGSVGLRPARDLDLPGGTRRFAPGQVGNLHLMYLYVHSLWWSGGLHATGRWTGDAAEDGVTVPDSGSARTRLGAHVTYALQVPYWEITGAVWLDPWWDHGAANQPFVGPTASLTLQRSWL
ncbi:MAG: hypothetical protein KC613_27765 [Myxococcales bacterium]|nr:hypothetical protein [Myxococcales bacterium]MCB9523995.1 hypothetical protein [Myxococcales bacterium]